jgi:septum site-determining protein MinD
MVRDVQEALGVPLLGAIPEDSEIISTNRGEPLVLQKLSLSNSEMPSASRLVNKTILLI